MEFEKSLRRAEQEKRACHRVPGYLCRTLPELPSGPGETLYIEKLRFRRCFLCSRYHASVEYVGKMSPQGALFFPRVCSVVWQKTSETVKGLVLHIRIWFEFCLLFSIWKSIIVFILKKFLKKSSKLIFSTFILGHSCPPYFFC